MKDQTALALTLVAELRECGHDITPHDLLDSLASTGLLLDEGEGAQEAYFGLIADDLKR